MPPTQPLVKHSIVRCLLFFFFFYSTLPISQRVKTPNSPNRDSPCSPKCKSLMNCWGSSRIPNPFHFLPPTQSQLTSLISTTRMPPWSVSLFRLR